MTDEDTRHDASGLDDATKLAGTGRAEQVAQALNKMFHLRMMRRNAIKRKGLL